jgi:DNA invertase Pin-like site-specific DNA recombinase
LNNSHAEKDTALRHSVTRDKAGVLIRVSTSRQGERGVSVKTQREDCLEYAERQGWDVAIIEEDHQSGTTFDRDGFRKLSDAAKQGVITKLVVHNLDRFGRGDMLSSLLELGIFDDAGCEVHSIKDGGLVEDSLIRDVRLAINKDFSRQLSEKVSRNMAYRAKSGNLVSRPPFGYRSVPVSDGKGATAEPDENAWAVRELFRLADEGKTESELLAFVKKHGLRASATGKTLGRTSIKGILKNEFYIGKIVWNRKGVGKFRQKGNRAEQDVIRADGLHPALVDEDTFARVQVRFDERRTYRAYAKSNIYLLDGLVFCGKCGAKMRGTSHASKGRRYLYYQCADRHDFNSCDQPRLSAETVDAEVRAVIRDTFNVFDVTLETAVDELVQRQESLHKGFGDFRIRLERRRDQLGQKLTRLLDKYTNDGVTHARRVALDGLIRGCEEELEGVEQELGSLRPEDEQLRDIEVAIEWFRDWALIETIFVIDGNDEGLDGAVHVARTSAECWGIKDAVVWQRVVRQFVGRVELEGLLKKGCVRLEWSATGQSIVGEPERVLQFAKTVRPTAGARSAERLR